MISNAMPSRLALKIKIEFVIHVCHLLAPESVQLESLVTELPTTNYQVSVGTTASSTCTSSLL